MTQFSTPVAAILTVVIDTTITPNRLNHEAASTAFTIVVAVILAVALIATTLRQPRTPTELIRPI